MPDLLDDLTETQREAVLHGDGPMLVVAGAGSGKTRVITRRVAHLAAQGVPPYRILAITFTNKAAAEMNSRVQQLVGARGAWISTFHSLCARMLRQFQELLGFSHPFTIYDRSDSLACLKAALAESRLTGSRVRPQSFLAAISRAKNDMLTPEELTARAARPDDREIAAAYAAYERLCRSNNALDFDDLLVCAARLLRDNRDFRTYWQTRFRHVLIDEYQDTNRPQYLIAREFAADHRNICATGDPDQSIYGWRGADISNILDFKKDYPDAHVVKLEENFRSTQMILLAASGVIQKNKARIPRGLWTRNEAGAPVQVVSSATDVDEGDAIVAGIRASQTEGFGYGGMAVFYRTHAQSRVIEDALRDAGIPYDILDALEFYNRKEIKDIVAYLKAIVNPADGVSVARVINEPKRGIGPRTVSQVSAHAMSGGLTLSEALAAGLIPGLPQRIIGKLAEFSALMARLRNMARSPVADLVRAVLKETGYLELLKKSAAEEDKARAENVEELVNAAAAFDLDYPGAGLEEFLERVTLVSDSDSMTGEQGRAVLMTLHSAKGLEFPVVFIAGVQEGLLPHMNSNGSPARVEEERRLFYVGITRAKKKLFLHWASEHLTYGMAGEARMSRFIHEIPASARSGGRSLLEPEEESGPGHGVSFAAPPARTELHEGRVIEYDEPVVRLGRVWLRAGERVRHPNFGEGRVVSISGSGERATVVVNFGGRNRHLMLRFASLTRIG